MLSNCADKMYCGKFEAARKFWETPVLVNKLLLPYLDLESTLHLAQTHELTRDILQDSFAWNKLVSRTRIQDGGYLHFLMEEKMKVVRHLAAILKLMTQADDQRANMLDLLDTICKRNPPDVGSESPFRKVTISCLNHPDSHQVFLEDYLLLEAIEGALGTSEQKAISSTGCFLAGPSLSALSSRLARQQEKLTLLGFGHVSVRSLESAEAFKTLMQASSEVVSGRPYSTQYARGQLKVQGEIGGKGWNELAEGVRLHPGLLLTYVHVLKPTLDEASKEDIRVIWDALEPNGYLIVELEDPEDGKYELREDPVWKEEGEDGWIRLTKIMEMSKEQAAVRAQFLSAEAQAEECKIS